MSEIELDLQGSIEKFTLPEIFQLIAASRKSGTLGIQQDDRIVMVYFEQGDVIYGYGPRQTFHLGQLLKEQGLITAVQLEEAVTAQARTENSRRLGEILVEKGFIDRADLGQIVKEQVESLLYSLLEWQTGSFKFYENQFPTEEEITVRISVENVILEGLRRLDEQQMIREVIPDQEVIFSISTSQAGRQRAVTLEAEQWNVMALVDGHRTIKQVCTDSQLGYELALTRLAQLKLAGIITPLGKRSTSEMEQDNLIVQDNLEEMVHRLADLFENYLKESASGNRDTTRISSEAVGEKS